MTMARRHFEFIARTIAEMPNERERTAAAYTFADALRSINPRFDIHRFLKACDVE